MNKMCTINQNENNYQDYYHKRFVTESRPIKKIKNYVNTEKIKSGASDSQQTTDEYYTDHSCNDKKRIHLLHIKIKIKIKNLLSKIIIILKDTKILK